MALDFNTEPFFDDYSEDDKFHRILFRPGYAVQARELTQLQTILQEQVRRHGDHMFKEGSMIIPGQISYDTNLAYVKLVTDIAVDISAILSSLVGKEVKNADGLIAKVVAYTLAETVTIQGNSVLEPHTLFIKYLNSVQDNVGNNVSAFTVGDVLSPTDGTSGLDVTVSEDIENGYPPVGVGCSATIQRGIYYIKKNFVLVQDQTIVLDKYTNTPDYRVGLKLVESIVYPEDDEQLLDNALGSPNYAAPGAARYKMDLVLTKIPQDPDQVTISQETDFIDLLRLRNGEVVFRIDRTTYAEIEKTLARRTYDESGDYALSPFGIQARDYRNNLRGDWAANEKFIQGDIIKVPYGTNFLYFVATTAGLSGGSRPTFDTYQSVDNYVDNQITWEYVPYPNFNNGVYTFTAGNEDFAEFTLTDHIRLDGMLALGVEAGKAYVRGYEIEKISTEYLPTQKSRALPAGSAALCAYFGVDSLPEVQDSVSVSKTATFDLSMGSYVIVNNVEYLPNISTLPQVKLHSVVKASATANTVIGYARVRAFEKHETGSYKLFLFDIKMNTGKDFANVKSIYDVATTFSCDMVQTSGKTVIQNPDDGSLIWQLPDYAIADISEVTYSVVAPFAQTASSGAITVAAPAGYTFESINNTNNYIVANNSTGAIVASPSLAISSGSLVVSGLTNGTSYTVFATMLRADATSAQAIRTLTDATPMQLTTQAAAQAKTITLNHSYVTRIVSVMMSISNTSGTTWDSTPVYTVDITNRYTFNGGQDGAQIALSSISLVPGAEAPIGPIMIKYEYVNANKGSLGDFSGLNSYAHATSRIRYDQIPVVGSFPLRDSIDFRPYMVGSSFDARWFPKFGSTGSFKYVNNLSRIDNIAISSTGQFVVSRGIPSDSPSEPNTPALSMKLAQVSIEPYTFKRGDSLGVVINRQENKRYTMRDIGKLERRIQDLEYYTSLTLTELDTKNMRIVDSEGFERYQNGFLVDTFDGQGVGNAASDDWNASIDSTNKELRPFFEQKQVSLLENVGATTKNYKVSGDLVTLPFTEVDLIVQKKASMTENVNPYALYAWKGVVDINPWSDTWFSTHHRPDIILNDESQYNAIVAKAEADGILGTVWNSWQTAFSSSKSLGSRLQQLGAWSTANTEILNATNNGGSFWRNRATFTAEEMISIGGVPGNLSTGVAGSRVLTIETTAVETTATRSGTRSFVVDKVDSRVLEDRVVDTQVVPYIRPRAVLFTGFGFKPSTNMYGYFDNVLVNEYITPAICLEVTPIAKSDGSLYPFQFDTTRNAGSAVSSDPARSVLSNDGIDLSGTITLTQGSATVTGLSTAFLSQVQVGDELNFGIDKLYKVATITDNYTLTLTTTWTNATVSGISANVIPAKTGRNTEEIEIAFNHGEVIKEVNGNGNTAIVVGQEVYLGKYYIYVLNVRGSGTFSTSSSAYLEGEYTVGGTKPRVKFIAKTVPTSLTSSYTGLLCGIFRIPSSPLLKFRTGTRELRFSDSTANTVALRAAQESTSGGAFYEAKGLVEIMQRTIVSTRTANIVSQQVSDTNTIVTVSDRLTRDTGWYDPLAQTFLVQQDGGAFITSVDLFFASRDEKVPVRVEIREVVNGYPGSTILPFSVVEKKGGSVNVDATKGSLATTFTFTSPVYLQNGVEYALVVLSDSNNYKLWISQTDTIDVETNVRISSQPYNGVLFKSQNASTWTADQTQDMKFVIRRAEFSSSPVSIEFIPPKLTFADLGWNPLNFITGSRRCRIEHKDHGMIAGEYVVLKTRQIIDSINGIDKQYIFDTPLQILSAELDSYVVEFGGTVNSTATGRAGGSYLCASENFEFSTAMLEVSEIVPEGTSISYTAKVINHADQVSEYKMIPKENVTFEEVKVYPSEYNYTSSTFPSGLSIVATLNPSNTLRSVSPVIDLGRVAMTMVSNKIDKPDLDINDTVLDYFVIGQGVEIGSGKALDMIDANGDASDETLRVNSGINQTLFDNMNNQLNAGDVIKVTYSGITDANRFMTIVDKRIAQNEDGVSFDMFFQLEGVYGEVLTDTTVGQTVDIWWLSHFKSEYASLNSSTTSKYVTKKINFSRPSEMLKIMFDAVIPNDADVEIYYKTGLSVSSDFIDSRYYKAIPNSYVKNATEFSAIIADVENLEPFDSVMVKLVMKSINKSQVPRIKNFRVIACAA